MSNAENLVVGRVLEIDGQLYKVEGPFTLVDDDSDTLVTAKRKYRRKRKAVGAERIDDKHSKGEGLIFYIDVLLRSKEDNKNLPELAKQIKKIPSSMEEDLSEDQMEAAEAALAAKELWLISIDGEGWYWTGADQKLGFKNVEKVQTVLQYLQKQKTASNPAVIYACCANKTVNPNSSGLLPASED